MRKLGVVESAAVGSSQTDEDISAKTLCLSFDGTGGIRNTTLPLLLGMND